MPEAWKCGRPGCVHKRGCHGHKKPARGGGPCGSYPIAGGTVCWLHGGRSPHVEAAAERRVLQAEALGQLAQLGGTVEVLDGEGLQAMRAEAAGNVVALRQLVRTLDRVYEPILHANGTPSGRAEPHVLVVMYDQACDRLARLDEVCVKLGLAERQDARAERVADATVDRLFAATGAALEAAGLSPGQRKLFTAALAAELRSGS